MAIDVSTNSDRDQARRRIAETLRAQWRMIASVSLRPCRDGDGFEAELRLDPIVVKGSFEQQGYPRTPDDLSKAEARRHLALEQCVEQVNDRLDDAEKIRGIVVVG